MLTSFPNLSEMCEKSCWQVAQLCVSNPAGHLPLLFLSRIFLYFLVFKKNTFILWLNEWLCGCDIVVQGNWTTKLTQNKFLTITGTKFSLISRRIFLCKDLLTHHKLWATFIIFSGNIKPFCPFHYDVAYIDHIPERIN
jgi:hypothetical protein